MGHELRSVGFGIISPFERPEGRGKSQPEKPLGVGAENQARRFVIDPAMLGHDLDRVLVAHLSAHVGAVIEPTMEIGERSA
jgi:hypothetical protein